MNLCVDSTFACTVDDFRAAFKESEEELRKCASEWQIGVVNDHKVIIMVNVLDMDALEILLTSPKITQWDADNNCVDVIYSLERIN